MGKLIITRKNSSTGVACKLNCYLDDKIVSKLGVNEKAQAIDVENKIYKFKCKLTMNLMSDIYELDFVKNEYIKIEINPEGLKPKINISIIDINENNDKKPEEIFEITKNVRNYLYIDEINQLWCIPKLSFWNGVLKKDKTSFYKFDDIVKFELQVEGNVEYSSTSGGTGRAIAGGMLFGVPGALIGATTAKKNTNYYTSSEYIVNITIKDMRNPNINITVSDRKIANEIISILQLIYIPPKNKYDNIVLLSQGLKNYKELLDMGVITESEFNKKKEELLCRYETEEKN